MLRRIIKFRLFRSSYWIRLQRPDAPRWSNQHSRPDFTSLTSIILVRWCHLWRLSQHCQRYHRTWNSIVSSSDVLFSGSSLTLKARCQHIMTGQRFLYTSCVTAMWIVFRINPDSRCSLLEKSVIIDRVWDVGVRGRPLAKGGDGRWS